MRRWPSTMNRMQEQHPPETGGAGGDCMFRGGCHGTACPDNRERKQAVEDIVSRAFITAHLLTGNTEQAESATMEAIGSWKPDDENESVLLQITSNAAARAPIKLPPSNSSEQDEAESYLPVELRRVLRLASTPRRCFVLRVLVGLPPQVCAQLLHLGIHRIDQYSYAALECLSALDRS